MWSLLLFSLIIASIILKVLFDSFKTKNDNNIPIVQPRRPIVGNALQLNLKKTHLIFTQWAAKFGPVYEVKLFNLKFIVLNNYDHIYDALVKKGSSFAGRPNLTRTARGQRNKNSIVWQTYTPYLVYLRKQAIKHLRPYAIDDLKMEEKSLPEVRDMIQNIKGKNGSPFNPWPMLFDATSNVMLILLTGHRFKHGSEAFKDIFEINERFNRVFGTGESFTMDFMPFLDYKKQYEFAALQEALKMRDNFWNDCLHNNKIAPDSVIGVLLEQFRQCETEKNEDRPFNELTAKEVFTNLLLAGTDTTAVAITCLLLILIHHKEIQERIQKEIDDVIGLESPKMSDRNQMPFTVATLLELLRYISHLPLSLPHCAIEDTSVGAYSIPKDTTIYINIWAMHHDASFWKDPWTFDPTRFLDEQGKILSPFAEVRKRLMPFGAGRRICLGEKHAEGRLFLFVTSLLQTFHFAPEDENNLPEVDPRSYRLGLGLHPQPFKVRAYLRTRVF